MPDGTYQVDFVSDSTTPLTAVAGQYQVTVTDVTAGRVSVANTVRCFSSPECRAFYTIVPNAEHYVLADAYATLFLSCAFYQFTHAVGIHV